MSPDTKNPSPGYLSLKALARELSVSDRTVHALIHDKLDPIPCHRIGRKIIRVHRADLKAWMDRRRSITPNNQLMTQAEAIVGRILRGE